MAKLKIIDTEAGEAPLDLFSYAALSREDEASAREDAAIIRANVEDIAKKGIEIGQALERQQAKLSQEDFEKWVRDECNLSRTTAYRLMKVAKDVGAIPSMGLTRARLGTTALELLVSDTTPQEVRDHVEALLVDGQKVTVADIRRMKAEARGEVEELRARLAGVEQAKAGRDRAVAIAQDEISDRDEKIKALQSGQDQRVASEVAAASKRIEKGFQAEIDRLKREITELKKPKLQVLSDQGDGNVVEFHRPLTEQEKAEIDAADDEYAGADFNKVASEKDRARAVVGSVHLIASAAAKPNAVYVELTERFSKKLIAENFATLDQALALLQQVKELHK